MHHARKHAPEQSLIGMKILTPVREHYHRHPYGSCLIRQDNQHDYTLIYVTIPKCASTWMKHVFKPAQDADYREISGAKHYVVILRDPIDRWISGFAQAQVGTTPYHKSHFTHLGWDQVFAKIVFDNHTEPQVSFLAGIDTQDVTWFKFGDDLYDDVQHWAQSRGWSIRQRTLEDSQHNEFNQSRWNAAQIFTDPRDPSVSTTGPSAWEIQQQARDAMSQRPRWRQQLLDFYHRDFELINSVNFYRKELQ